VLTTDGLAYSLDVLAFRDTVPTSFLSKRASTAANKALASQVAFSDQGDNAESAESRGRLLTGLAIGILLLFGILAPAYGSISLALLSILILPLSVIGAIWALLAFDKALALPAVLGIILLFSFIIKNSILMVDFIQVLRRNGATPMAAAMEAVRLHRASSRPGSRSDVRGMFANRSPARVNSIGVSAVTIPPPPHREPSVILARLPIRAN
jgi:hypothetical protein